MNIIAFNPKVFREVKTGFSSGVFGFPEAAQEMQIFVEHHLFPCLLQECKVTAVRWVTHSGSEPF